MSTRRPRIKAAANLALASKRKPKSNADIKLETKVDSEEKSVQVKVESTVPDVSAEKATTNGNQQKAQENLIEIKLLQETHPSEDVQSATLVESIASIESPESTNCNDPIPPTIISPSTLDVITPTEPPIDQFTLSPEIVGTVIPNEPIQPLPSPLNSPEILQNSSGKTLQSFEDAFKYPFNPNYKRPSAVVAPVEENVASDFEDNILHMDLQKSPGFPMSPTKSRQRIRPTPIFGQRRNSFVGTSPSPHTEDEPTGTTRQRSSNSTSSDVSGSFLMRKLAAGNLGRIRTESGCSTISESRGSTRKIPNDEQTKSYRRELHMRLNGGTPDKSTLKMFDLIYYNPTTNPMEKKPIGITQTGDKSSEVVIEAESKKNPTTTESAMPVPQLKLGSNGELMIDEMSLEIETTAEVEARKVLANTGLIYHDENTSGEGFYKRSKRTKDWQPEETIKFYRCLQTVGTDFSLMLTLFPNRTRRDLKLKFKKEERCNLNLINKALLFPGTFNIEDLKDQLDAEDKERQEQERLWKEIKAKEAKHTKKTLNVVSKTSRILTPGDEIYQNENVTKAKLSKRSAGKDKSQSSEPKEKRKRKSKKAAAAEDLNPKTEPDNEIDDILDITSEIDTIDSMTDDGLNEASINLILNELANGTLALVSSEDLSNPNKTTFHEIYIMCKETKQLSDKPLDLPEDIVNAILTAMTS